MMKSTMFGDCLKSQENNADIWWFGPWSGPCLVLFPVAFLPVWHLNVSTRFHEGDGSIGEHVGWIGLEINVGCVYDVSFYIYIHDTVIHTYNIYIYIYIIYIYHISYMGALTWVKSETWWRIQWCFNDIYLDELLITSQWCHWNDG